MPGCILIGLLLCSTSSLAKEVELVVEGLPKNVPFTMNATATEEKLCVIVDLEPEWHMYGRNVGGGQPVSVVLDKGPFEAAGPLEVDMDEGGKILGHQKLTLPIRRISEGSHLQARFSFSVCDPLMCLPPMEVTLKGEILQSSEPVSVLLVTNADDDRSRRIQDFLTSRGFSCDHTSYHAVTLEACDAHDVVVADSHYFGSAGSLNEGVKKFPLTRSPVVAVGFLGTVLIQGAGLALTSGYI